MTDKEFSDLAHVVLAPCNADYSPDVLYAEEVCIIGECTGVYHGMKYQEPKKNPHE